MRYLIFLLFPLLLYSTEIWMEFPSEGNKGEPLGIRIYFGDYGVRKRPFFGKLILYITDPLRETYKIPLRRERNSYTTFIIPDVPGLYRLKCVGFYFGDKFVTSGTFFVKSFLHRDRNLEEDTEVDKDVIGVTEVEDGYIFTFPECCPGGSWIVKDEKGREVLRKEGVKEIELKKMEGSYLVIYTRRNWIFSYLIKGGGGL